MRYTNTLHLPQNLLVSVIELPLAVAHENAFIAQLYYFFFFSPKSEVCHIITVHILLVLRRPLKDFMCLPDIDSIPIKNTSGQRSGQEKRAMGRVKVTHPPTLLLDCLTYTS